ncbi:hypothetical protein KKE87_01045, partial [Patescibacteria group bacterium]|nr:hypothetical protein [Patescibacteria group bacterium]
IPPTPLYQGGNTIPPTPLYQGGNTIPPTPLYQGGNTIPPTPLYQGGNLTPLSALSGRRSKIKVKVEDFKLCPRYMAIVLDGIKIENSPEWMRKRLLAAGMRPINNIVDITNYVMLELGQPTHIFDLKKIENAISNFHPCSVSQNRRGTIFKQIPNPKSQINIIIRKAKNGEIIKTLDGQDQKLDDSMLVIADTEKPIAIAGIIGGANSEVDEKTSSILIESANFNPVSIRKTAQKLGLRSEASTRFEKSLDPNLCEIAFARIVELIEEFCPQAKIISELSDEKKYFLNQGLIKLNLEWVEKRIGKKIEKKKIVEILENLGFEINKDIERPIGRLASNAISVAIPSWRAKDVSISEDLIEEIVRIYGYDNLNPEMPKIAMEAPEINNERLLERKIKNILSIGAKLTEVYNYSFIGEKRLKNTIPPTPLYQGGNTIPPTPLYQGGNTIPPSLLYQGGNTIPPSLPYQGGNTIPPSLPYQGGNTIPPSLPYQGGNSIPPSLPYQGGNTIPPSLPCQGGNTIPPTPLYQGGNTIPPTPLYQGGNTIPQACLVSTEVIKLANPLSEDLTFLRPSLVLGILENIKTNQAQEAELAIYEIGSIFLNKPGNINKDDSGQDMLPFQEKRLAMALAHGQTEYLFRKLKGVIEFLLKFFNLTVNFELEEKLLEDKSGKYKEFFLPAEMTKTVAVIIANTKPIGQVVELEKSRIQVFGIKKPVVIAEISLTALLNLIKNQPVKQFKELPKHPEVLRDLAFVVNEKILYNNMVKKIKNFSDLIKQVKLFDIYQGDKLGQDKKSLAFHIIYQADKTLTSQEVDEIQAKLVQHLEKEFKAKARDF